jgi:uncharacterized LabA/DUF88 family protein
MPERTPTPDPLRVVVFIDYQNVMRDARRAFCGQPFGAADGQIDPLRYGQHLVARQPLGTSGARRLKEVRVYRGRPHSEKDPRTHAAHMRQTGAWEKAGVTVVTRDLRYPRDWPKERAEEKGIDVALAIDAVMMAVTGRLDIAILATTDSDQRPVLEAFHALPGGDHPIVEVATWKSDVFSKKLQIKGRHVWSHLLDNVDYRGVRDRRDYNVAS